MPDNREKKGLEGHLDDIIKERLRDDDNSTNVSPWVGANLHKNTSVINMNIHDATQGWADCYDQSTYSQEIIDAICEGDGSLRQLHTKLEQQGKRKSGMLNIRDVKPISVENGRTRFASVQEQLLSDLKRTQMITSGKIKGIVEGKSLALYRGKMLVPTGRRSPVIAYGTYEHSQLPATERTSQNDESVSNIVEIINSLRLETYVSKSDLIAHAPVTINFDTLDSRESVSNEDGLEGGIVKGGAAHLWRKMVKDWKKMGYERVILWRHKALQRVLPNVKKKPDSAISQGHNEESSMFFMRRKLQELGTRQASSYAIRTTNVDGEEQEQRILSTEGYMIGNLDEIEEACLSIEKGALAKK